MAENYTYYNSLHDEEIINLIVSKGKKDLFSILHKRYEKKVLDKCFSILRNKDLAIEAQQVIFEKTYEKLDSFKGKASFSSWLYRITYNYCIDFLRNKKKMSYPEWDRNNAIPEIIDEVNEEENQLNTDNLSILLDKIHPEEKALLMMKYADNMAIQEIAQALRLTDSAVKMRLKRARARLLYLYKQNFSEYE